MRRRLQPPRQSVRGGFDREQSFGPLNGSPAEAVARAREFVRQHAADNDMPIEVEVDSLDQLDVALPARPDIVLLDNMTTAELRQAVARRDAVEPAIELEASGGVSRATAAARLRRRALTGSASAP